MDKGSIDRDRFSAISKRSQALHGNNFVLPVAVSIVRLDANVVSTPEIREELGGLLPDNRILDGLVRLCQMAVMTELPYPGRPKPRLFERRESAYWDFVVPFTTEHHSSLP